MELKETLFIRRQGEDGDTEAAPLSTGTDSTDQVPLDIQDGLIESMQQGDFTQFETLLRQINFNEVSSAPYLLASACWCDDSRYIIEALQAGVNPNTVIKDDVITITYQRVRGHNMSADSMFSDHHRKYRRAIHIAAGAANLQVLGALLDHPSTDKEAVDLSRDTWLHYFARQPYISRSRDKKPNHFPRDLLQREETKKIANVQNKDNNSFLHLTALHCHFEIMEKALQNDDLDFNLSLKNYNGETSLHLLARTSPECESGYQMSCIKLLIKKGININANNKRKCTALHIAAVSGNYLVIRALLSNQHMYICSKDNHNFTAFHCLAMNNRLNDEIMLWCIRMFFKLDVLDVNEVCGSDRTPLHLCAVYENFVMFKELLKHHKIQVSKKDMVGMTAIHYMSMMKKSKFPNTIKNNLKALLDKGIDINSKDEYGQTALHIASMKNFSDMIYSLLDNGANILEKNICRKSVVDVIQPSTLETYMNRCISSLAMPHERNFRLRYNYKFLLSDTISPTSDSSHVELSVTYSLCTKRHLEHLLCHPLIRSFLYLKWRKWRTILFPYVVLYIIVMALLNACIISYTMTVSKNLTDHSNSSQNNTNEAQHVSLVPAMYVCLPVFTVFLLGKLLVPLILFPIKYSMTLTFLLELLICIASFYITFCFWLNIPIVMYTLISSIVVSWFQLILLTGSLPFFSVNLEMLKGVLITFIKYFSWYAIIIMGFALSFFVLSYRGDGKSPRPFLNLWSSIMQTVLLMSGQGEPSKVSTDNTSIVSDLMLLLFLIIIVVVLLNLLSGLAIGDTREIRSQAQLLSQKSMVRFIHDSEIMLREGKRMCCVDKLRYMVQVKHKLDKDCVLSVQPNDTDTFSSYFDELRHFCLNLLKFGNCKVISFVPSILSTSIIEETKEFLQKDDTIHERLCAQENKMDIICEILLQERTKHAYK